MGFDVTDVWTSSPMEREMGKSDVLQAIRDAASSSEVDPMELMQLAQIESNFDPQARAEGGKYRGLLQLDPMDHPPYSAAALEDPNIGAELGAKEYKKYRYEKKSGEDLGWEFDEFYEKVIRHNQGRKGSRQILNAYNKKQSIQQTSKAPWNRTKKMLNNMADEDLIILAKTYSKNKDLNRSRESLIESMIGKGADPSNLAIRSDPDVVEMYVNRQKTKVATSRIEVNKILKEM